MLATGFKFSTVMVVDLLELPKACVMTSAEAAAFADPASRLLWPHLRHLKLLQQAMNLAEKQSDWVLLFKAMYLYGDRVGAQAWEAYQIKLKQAQLQSHTMAQQLQQQRKQPSAQSTPPPIQPVAHSSDGRGSVSTPLSGLSGDVPDHWGGGPFGATIEPVKPYNPLHSGGVLEPLEAGDLLSYGGNG